MNIPRGARLGTLVLIALTMFGGSALAQDAARFFRQNCMSCHTIGGGRITGPDLKDVTKQKDRAWLQNFVQNPKAVIDAGDPYALKLRDEARGVIMPTIPGMTPERASALLDMIEAESKLPKSQFSGLSIGDQPFTAADIARGRAIFTGLHRLQNGGPPCISCHTAAGLAGLGGGRLGPDLTKVYERLRGRKGLASWLQAPATPTMRAVFFTRTISNDEIVPIVAFLESEARGPSRSPRSPETGFFLLGMSGAIVGLVSADVVWRRRFRGVRKPLVRGDE